MIQPRQEGVSRTPRCSPRRCAKSSAPTAICGARSWRAGGQWHVVQPREIVVLDRIGGGDGFVGGLLYAVLRGWEPENWIQFGWATGALATTMLTDYAQPADEEQVWSIWKGIRAWSAETRCQVSGVRLSFVIAPDFACTPLRAEPGAGRRRLGRPADRDCGDGNHRIGDPQHGSNVRNALLARVHAQPACASPSMLAASRRFSMAAEQSWSKYDNCRSWAGAGPADHDARPARRPASVPLGSFCRDPQSIG